jgi:hypothetical protein
VSFLICSSSGIAGAPFSAAVVAADFFRAIILDLTPFLSRR